MQGCGYGVALRTMARLRFDSGPAPRAMAARPAGSFTRTGVSISAVPASGGDRGHLDAQGQPDPDWDVAVAGVAVAKFPEGVVSPGQHHPGGGERQAVLIAGE